MTAITFIGSGNMATSIIGGLISQGHEASNITACDPNTSSLDQLSEQFSVTTTTNNLSGCIGADVIVLAVKPQIMKIVAEDLRPALAENPRRPVIISIAAGIEVNQLNQWLGDEIAIVRCMPNTPALVQQGAAGLYANEYVSVAQKSITEELLQAVGIVTWVESEELIDTVTAVSGSGPAYFFLLMESMIEAGMQQGLSLEQARHLTLQTAAGAAKLAQQSEVDVNELRRRVTSPGGTTEQAILSFEKAGFRQIVGDAMAACTDRSKAMASEFS